MVLIMFKEERELQFRRYLKTCNDFNELVGLGNPYAKILLVGQESAGRGNAVDLIRKNIEDVTACFNNGDLHKLYNQSRFYPDRVDKNGNRILNRTWNAYQKLIDYIRPEEKRLNDPENTDFCKDAFTTEINNTVSPHNPPPGIEWKPRIDTFKASEYIKGFPVVILACSHYIQNGEDNWQINETFDVTFDLTDGAHKYTKGMSFYTHHNADRSRLVIHTRQLSQYSDALLRGMAGEIQKHFNEIGESYEAVCY